MPVIDFNQFCYFPALLASDVERLAFDELSVQAKETTLPIFELARYRTEGDFGHSMELLHSLQAGSSYLLDIDKRAAPPPYQAQNPGDPRAEALRVAQQTETQIAFNAQLSRLLQPTNGFENWRQFSAQFPNAVPVLQFTNPVAQQMNILRQAALLSQGGQSIAMRVRSHMSEISCQIAAQILALLPTSSQLLLIFDAGQSRRDLIGRGEWIANSMDIIVSEMEIQQQAGLVAVAMSNSFNAPSHSGMREAVNHDWTVWNEALEPFAFRFGDYGASQRQTDLSAFVPRSFRATVVHSLDQGWLIHRHENADDPNGWVVGAQAIVNHDSFDPINSWSDNIIVDVANNGLGQHSTSRTWHAVRVSGHLERQARYAQEMCF